MAKCVVPGATQGAAGRVDGRRDVAQPMTQFAAPAGAPLNDGLSPASDDPAVLSPRLEEGPEKNRNIPRVRGCPRRAGQSTKPRNRIFRKSVERWIASSLAAAERFQLV